jgi:pimeloyl-ACP methyl ester carboxylesterase
MSSFDSIDQEVDEDMGWAKKGAKRKMRRGPDYWQAVVRAMRVSSPLWRVFKRLTRPVLKVVFFPIISPLGYTKRFNMHGDMVLVKRSFTWRVADFLLTRLLLAPVILAAFLVCVVYASTHPSTVQAMTTPDSYGLYYKRINLFTLDNQRLMSWYIPPINADEVAFDPEGTLTQRWPAVVLCHGLGSTHDQYMPLARSLHDLGFGVLLLDMRGQGESEHAAVTYGLRERLDVLAGVKFLRETAYIDGSKICVVGHDVGATAVLEAATLDSSIAAVVADGLWPRFEDRARDIFSRPSPLLNGSRLPAEWLAPLYTLAFEIGVRDRLSQLDTDTVVRNIHTQPVLFVARSGPDYSPVQDVLALATSAGGKHEVIMENGEWERKVCAFLVTTTQWRGPKSRGIEQIENLLKNKVSPAR